MEKKSNKLNLFTLVCIAVGNVVGAGIITTTGLAIAQTGRSVWISSGLAVLCGFLWLYPVIVFSSCARYRGGAYAQASVLMGRLAGGIYSLMWLPMFLMMGMMASGLGLYIHSVVPSIPAAAAGIAAITLFYTFNLLGVGSMSKLQNPMTVFLLLCLLAFAFVGFGKVDSEALAVTSPSYYLNGGIGLIDGIMLLVYSTSGHSLVTAMSWDAKDPKKNIPKAIIISTGVILVLYCTVSFVAGNVLPVEQVAGQPLTYVAKVLFPGPLFIVFIIGGPIMALATSTNAGFATLCAPAMGAIKNGWLPAGIARTNKNGAPWILYTIMYLISVLPLMCGVSLSALTAYNVMTQRACSIILLISAFRLPTVLKEQWEKSWMHMPNAVYYGICTLSLVTNVIALILNVRTLNVSAFVLNLTVAGILALVAVIRFKQGKIANTKITISYADDDSDEE